jgi:Bacterial extracellular solute-binding proteins, family 5 Middle
MPGRRFATFGFLVCLQATCASSSRSPAVGATAPQPPSDPPATVATTPAAEADPDECAVIAPAGEPVTTVALGDRIDPSNAPRPSNESERLLFRQLYETLVRADCRGRAAPGLAASWRLDADGRTWIVTLRDAAQFSDGTPVTAAAVRASWLGDGRGDALHPHVNRLVESIVPVADGTLAIRLHSQRVDVPLALAHPDLAVAKVIADRQWPLGTRAARIAPGAGAVPSIASAAITLTRDNLPAIRFLVARGDARDLLDHGVDLLLTRDPAALDYAATLPQFESVALAWQRTYVLLTPGRSRAVAFLPEDARQVLAGDAVRGEARGAQGPFWWQTWAACGIAAVPPSGDQPPPISRIVYDASDTVARDLAERFVGLARAPGVGADTVLDAILPDRPRRTFQRAMGLTGAALTATQRQGADAGYIVFLDTRPPDPCRDLRALLEKVPWLDPETIVPLVEARMQAIVRRGIAGVTAEWDGGLLIAGPKTR